MPLGLNRTDLNTTGITYKDGFPVTEPLEFGTPITEPHEFGSPVTTPIDVGNPVTWPTPDPAHFGNIFNGVVPPIVSGFELEDGSGVILLEDGSILLLEVQ